MLSVLSRKGKTLRERLEAESEELSQNQSQGQDPIEDELDAARKNPRSPRIRMKVDGSQLKDALKSKANFKTKLKDIETVDLLSSSPESSSPNSPPIGKRNV